MRKLVIEKAKLQNNIDIIKKMTSSTIIAVLKGNGYGLGLVEFARLLQENSIDYFAVSTLEEALTLRQNGMDGRILLLAPPGSPEEAEIIVNYNIMPTIGSIHSASLMEEAGLKAGKSVDLHLKIDTGFGRFGFLWNETDRYSTGLKSLSCLNIVGTYTHLSYSFEKKARSIHLQFERFLKSVESLKAAGIPTGMLHIANSCAFLRFPAMHLDAVRIGSAFLGRIPIENPYGLEKIGFLKSRIIDVKTLPKGYSIGYANTYRTKKETRIGIVPIGYKDGFGIEKSKDTFRFIDILRYIYHDIKLLNKHLFARLGDQSKVRILGRVSMFNIVLDLTGTGADIGDEVILEVNPVLVEGSVEREYI
ncbi:MAG: alanine racemase [Eubacteriales bacterium]|jgi:alanine racemase|nr:alanine racemase [Eubacteriales bacterium]